MEQLISSFVTSYDLEIGGPGTHAPLASWVIRRKLKREPYESGR